MPNIAPSHPPFAGTVHPNPQLPGLSGSHRLGRHRRRRPRRWPAVMSAAAVMVIGAACGNAGGPETSSALGATAAASDAHEGAAPSTFVAVTDHGTDLVVVDTDTGEVRRTLVDLGDGLQAAADPANWSFFDGVALTADGATVHYSTGPEPLRGHRGRIGIDGSQPVPMAGEGYFPATGFDSGELAWVTHDGIAVAGSDGGERFFAERRPYQVKGDLAWAPGSERLAYAEQVPSSIQILDFSAGHTTLSDADELPGTHDKGYFALSYRAFDGALGALQVRGGLSPASQLTSRVLVMLNPVDGAEISRLDLPFDAVAASFDRSGHHQLFVDSDGAAHHHRDGSFRLIPGLGGVSHIAW